MSPSLVIAETVRRQHVAKKAISLRNRKVKLFCVLMVLVLCLSLIYVWTRISVVQKGYEVSRLSKEVEDLIRDKNRLEAEVVRLKSPARLEKIASRKFGMRLPLGEEIIFVEP